MIRSNVWNNAPLSSFHLLSYGWPLSSHGSIPAQRTDCMLDAIWTPLFCLSSSPLNLFYRLATSRQRKELAQGRRIKGGQRVHKGVHILAVSESKPFHLKKLCFFAPPPSSIFSDLPAGLYHVGATSKEPKQHEEWSDLLQIRPWASKQAKQAHSTYYCTLVHFDDI